jgi:arylsulfatase A-like enzyme
MNRRRAWTVAALLAALATGLLVLAPAVRRTPAPGRIDLTALPDVEGRMPRVGPVELEGDRRPALLETTRFRLPLPDRPLLTFAAGVDWAGTDEAPGWYHLVVRMGDVVLAERKLNPRAARDWRDVSVELPAGGGERDLTFELRFTDRDGRDIPKPAGLITAVGEPVVHDLAAFGAGRGIVLVSIDTLRRDHVGTYGYARPTTPRLDALAREGLVVEDAVSVSSWTLPSHLSMLTSVDPARHGGTDMDHRFNGSVATLPALLRAAGFRTRAVTSHLYVSAVYGLDSGFEHLDFRQDRKAKEVADRAIALLDRVGDQPFFLFLHFYDPHWHYDPPPETLKLFEESYAGSLTGLWQEFSRRPRDQVSAADLQHLLALYDGEIRATDDQLGRVLDHLARRALGDTTLVVVTSDHGEEFLEHGHWEHQRTLYEEVVRIPLVMRGPGIRPRRETAPASLLDVAPTITAWAGLPASGSFQGRSLLETMGPGGEAYGETQHTTDSTDKLFLRAGADRWKLILSQPRAGGPPVEEWFDLRADPGELKPTPPREEVAGPIRARALERFRSSRAGAPKPATVCLDAEQQERLRALGYVSGGGACPDSP